MPTKFQRQRITGIHPHVTNEEVLETIKESVADENIHKYIRADQVEIQFTLEQNTARKTLTLITDRRLHNKINKAHLIDTLTHIIPREIKTKIPPKKVPEDTNTNDNNNENNNNNNPTLDTNLNIDNNNTDKSNENKTDNTKNKD